MVPPLGMRPGPTPGRPARSTWSTPMGAGVYADAFHNGPGLAPSDTEGAEAGGDHEASYADAGSDVDGGVLVLAGG